ncbi:hypothetical protein B0H14DRAFT_3746088 [Mycena olivaceomarginata]|nr:hypothetical protein B0H14DRAFT_3746088 [Mycena olivaceomarginata]
MKSRVCRGPENWWSEMERLREEVEQLAQIAKMKSAGWGPMTYLIVFEHTLTQVFFLQTSSNHFRIGAQPPASFGITRLSPVKAGPLSKAPDLLKKSMISEFRSYQGPYVDNKSLLPKSRYSIPLEEWSQEVFALALNIYGGNWRLQGAISKMIQIVYQFSTSENSAGLRNNAASPKFGILNTTELAQHRSGIRDKDQNRRDIVFLSRKAEGVSTQTESGKDVGDEFEALLE